MRKTLILLATLAVVGCGSSDAKSQKAGGSSDPNSSVSVDGNLNGTSYTPLSASFTTGSNEIYNTSTHQYMLVSRVYMTLSNTASYCADYNDNIVRRDETLLYLDISNPNQAIQDANDFAPFTGDFNVTFDGAIATAYIDNSDAGNANCLSNPNSEVSGGAAGRLTITSMTSTSVVADFNITFTQQDETPGAVRGTFTAGACPALAQDACTRDYVCTQ